MSSENIDSVFALYEKYGSKGYIGEEISQLEHATQAAMLAEEDGQPLLVILAAFFHDIGHLLIYDNPELEKMGDYGVAKHENLGGDYLLEKGFDEDLCNLVRNHILTKRYLVTVNNDYYNSLSEASKKTFEYQGGLLTDEEVASFKSSSHYYYALNLKIREYDDAAKDSSFETKMKINSLNPIEYYKNLTERYFQLDRHLFN